MEQLQIRDVIRPSGTQSISRLPAELFVQIMKEVFILLEALPTDRPDRHTDWTNSYQLVCRHWRDIICSTPQLWQEIRVSQHPEWLELCLARCAGALASVHVTHAHYPPGTSATLRRHASSIKACHIFSDRDSLSALSSLFSTPMPALETLSLCHTPFEDIANVPVTFGLPRLSTLSLTNWSVPRDAAVFTSLRSLTLIDTLWPSSFDHFLDVMENARNLEHLDLNLVMLYRHHNILANLQVHPSSRRTPVVLPRLQVAKLHAPLEVLFDLFFSIYAPHATALEVGNNVTYRDPQDPDPQVARVLAPIVPLGYPFLHSPHSVFLRCWDGMLELRLQSPAGSLVCFLEHQLPMEELWPTAHLGQNLIAIMDVFSVASVDTLEVDGCPDRATADTWRRVFQGFPNLRTLHVRGRGTFHNLWHGLELATAAAMEHDGVMCCPLLSDFLSEVTADDWSDTVAPEFYAPTKLLETTRRALRARAEHCHDGRALQKLGLHLYPAKELYEKTAELHEALVEDIRALVGELEYREYPPT